jgi:hypothetical protein
MGIICVNIYYVFRLTPLFYVFPLHYEKKLHDLASLDKDALGSDMGDCARPYPSHFLGYGLSLAEAHVVRWRNHPSKDGGNYYLFSIA